MVLCTLRYFKYSYYKEQQKRNNNKKNKQTRKPQRTHKDCLETMGMFNAFIVGMVSQGYVYVRTYQFAVH